MKSFNSTYQIKMGYKKTIALLKEVIKDPNEARGTVWQDKAEVEIKKFEKKKENF